MIVTPDIFQGEISVGQIEFSDIAARVQWFINKYEPLYLKKLLGVELTVLLEAEFAKETHDVKWDVLAQAVEYMIANYVYFFYQCDNETKTAGVGEVTEQSENTTRTTVSYKMVHAWNEAVRGARQFRLWIDTEVYPEYAGAIDCTNSDIYEFKNTFGI